MERDTGSMPEALTMVVLGTCLGKRLRVETVLYHDIPGQSRGLILKVVITGIPVLFCFVGTSQLEWGA
jgi:hypothetical protein